VNNVDWDWAGVDDEDTECDPSDPSKPCHHRSGNNNNQADPTPVAQDDDTGCGPNHSGPCWHSTGNLDPYSGGWENNGCPEPIAPEAPVCDTYGQLSGQVLVDWTSWRLTALRDVTYEV